MKGWALAVAGPAALALAAPQAAACSIGAYGDDTSIRELCPFKDGLARILVGGKWGFVDRAGKVAIAPQFDEADDFADGFALAGLGERQGVIDRRGHWVVQPQFVQLGRFSGGMAAASRDLRHYGYIDHAGKWVIAPIFSGAEAFTGAVAPVVVGGKGYALIDRQGRIIKHLPAGIDLHPKTSRAALLHASTQAAPMLVHLDGRRRPLRRDADVAAYAKRHAIVEVEALPEWPKGANGLMPAKKGKQWGLVDAKGAWVSPPVLDVEPRPFIHRGTLLGWSSRFSKFYPIAAGHYIDAWLSPQGKLVAGRPRHSAITFDAKSRLLTVSEDDRFDSVMTNEGVVRIAPMYAALTPLRGGWFLVVPRKLHGLIDQRGAWQVAPRQFGMTEQSESRSYMIQFKGVERELMDLDGRVSTRAAPRQLGREEPSQDWWIDFTQHNSQTGYTIFNGFDFKPRVRIPGRTTAIQFSEGVIGFEPSDSRLAGHVGLIDDSGKTLGLYRHTWLGAMHDGMAVTSAPRPPDPGAVADVNLAVQYGYIDRAGKLAIPLQFAQAGDFSEGRATVVIGQHLAMIDKGGRVLLQASRLCGGDPVLLDALNKVIWPTGPYKAGKCTP